MAVERCSTGKIVYPQPRFDLFWLNATEEHSTLGEKHGLKDGRTDFMDALAFFVISLEQCKLEPSNGSRERVHSLIRALTKPFDGKPIRYGHRGC